MMSKGEVTFTQLPLSTTQICITSDQDAKN